ncbi:MAG: hypothetical protein CSA96_10420 [Bacteroidetes bacterium]|nr:MAG: hypothetical protein CSA96_10420 [Bacteroidota bacterium]
MKKLFSITLLFSLVFMTTQAQFHLFLEEQQTDYDGAKLSGWAFPVSIGSDQVLDDFKDFVKQHSDAKARKDGSNTMVAEKASIPALTTKRGDMIAHDYTSGSHETVILVFRMGYDICLDSQDWNPEMQNFRTWAKSFMAYHYQQSYTRRIEAVEKELKAAQKENKQNDNKISSLDKKEANLNKRMRKESDQGKIDERKADISTAVADRDRLIANQPGLDNRISTLRERIIKLTEESNEYQAAIAKL